MELFALGLGVGWLVGAGGKRVVKPIAKGAMVVTDKAKEWAANLREDFRDTIEEARYERERDAAADRDAEAVEETVTRTRAPRRRRARAAAE